MGERVESGHAEFDEHHQVKVSGATDILQARVSSNPNTTVNFGVEQVLTQWSVHAQVAQASSSDAEEPKVESTVTLTAAQLMEKLSNARIQARADMPVSAKSKDKVETKKDDVEMQNVELDHDGFKIPQGTAHRNNKKLAAEEHCKIDDRVLQRDLDPSCYVTNIVMVHELSLYEWRCYLLYLVNQNTKMLPLPLLSSKGAGDENLQSRVNY